MLTGDSVGVSVFFCCCFLGFVIWLDFLIKLLQ